MYKVIIADDEEYVIRSLQAAIHWEDQGFYIVDTANDGLIAWNKIKDHQPDLVFTDIRMPGMSGLELIQQASKEIPRMKFVLISGFAEFAYAQKAMNLGVSEYCIKPFDDDEILRIVSRMKKKLDEQKQQAIHMSRPSLLPDSAEALLPFLVKTGLVLSAGIIPVVVRGKATFTIPVEFVHVPFLMGLHKQVILFQSDYFHTNQTIILENLMREAQGIGNAHPAYDYADLLRQLDNANIAAYQSFIREEQRAFSYTTIDHARFEKCLKRIHQAIILKDSNSGVSKLKEVVELILQEGNMNHAYRLYSFITETLVQEDHQRPSYDFLYGFDDLILQFGNFTAMVLGLEEQILNLLVTVHPAETQPSHESLKEITEYICLNFTNPDISLDLLAKQFHFNPSYLSQLFRRDLGIKFMDYITELRMDYAMNLLRNTDLSVQQIGTRTGYLDYYYFTKLFKKKFQKKPSEARADI
ncbi:response regulator [Paenibacillus sp. FSL R10-2734]|uniref:response regulator n=1 Tax=Paenibacillus sp. FSL R10-2734 TaxID=2954691 RepID=UPI0030DCBCD5